MVEEAKKEEKKSTTASAKTAAAPKKAPVKKKVNKGQTLSCEVCGLGVTVIEVGDEVVEEDNVLLCCGQPMKTKVASKKTTAK